MSVGSGPDGVAYDSGKRELFVANGNSGNVSVIAEATGTVVATVAVGSAPWGLAYDPALNEVFVAESGSNDVRVINDATNQVVATVGLGGGAIPYGLAYDSGTREVFVADWGSNSVSVISAASNTVVTTLSVGAGPFAVAYDSAMGEVFVTNAGAGTVNVISDASDTIVATITVGSGPIGIAYDPAMGEVFVANAGAGTVSVISDASNTVVATVTLPYGPQGLAYAPGTGVAVIYIDNTPLAFGHMDVIADSSNTIVASVELYAGGTPDALTYDPGNGGWYVADSTLDAVIIVAPGYYVTFSETGLPAGTSWVVWLNGTTQFGASHQGRNSFSTTIRAFGSNGTYSFTVLPVTGYVASPSSGPITVAGAPVSQTITFSFPYSVTFTETGLPTGTNWSVTLAGTTKRTNSTTIVFTATNGTHSFTLGGVSGYVASPASGSVTVNGAAASQAIAFAPSSPGVSVELLLVAVVAVLAAVGIVVVLRRRGRPRS